MGTHPWKQLTFSKTQGDIDSLVESEDGTPDHLIVVAGGSVSASIKTKTESHAQSVGIRQVEVWSGPEFEERLRHYASTVLRRFFDGEELPDEPLELKTFVANTPYSKNEALRSLGRLFERPAFTTPFEIESSLPAFRRAISDTIEAINTGLHKNREGILIRRLPAKHDFEDPEVEARLSEIAKGLNELRMRFDEHLRSGKIQECGCSDPNCHTFSLDRGVSEEMNDLRDNVLSLADSTIPDFNVEPKF